MLLVRSVLLCTDFQRSLHLPHYVLFIIFPVIGYDVVQMFMYTYLNVCCDHPINIFTLLCLLCFAAVLFQRSSSSAH